MEFGDRSAASRRVAPSQAGRMPTSAHGSPRGAVRQRPRSDKLKFFAVIVASALLSAVWAGCADRAAPLVAFLGDSLTDGWGVHRGSAYPALVGMALAQRGRSIRVLNAGRGGDTVAQGRGRLREVLAKRPEVVVIALGVNDILRGFSVEQADYDLRAMVVEARTHGAKVILVGVRAPSPEAAELSRRFASMFRSLAAELDVPLVPDLLAGTSADADRMYWDGLHPSVLGHRQLAENVLPALERVLDELAAGRRPLARP